MNEKLPEERQAVEVCVNGRDWQAATYQDGEFIDAFGMPLDSRRISSWRAPGGHTHRLH